MDTDILKDDFNEARALLEEFIADEQNQIALRNAGDLLVRALGEGHKVIACGNGGSMCDAMHFAEELTGRYRKDRQPFPAIAISDPAHITCVANDFGFENVFSRFIEAMGQEGDVLLAISTSGNSENIIRAVDMARQRNMHVLALTGNGGGMLGRICDIQICAPFSAFSDRVQEIHIKVLHTLVHYVEQQNGLT
jgi:D-sedoheptulose 7-phosphate isomerase